MSADDKTAEKPKKKKGGFLIKAIGGLALCGAGAGGAYAYFLSTHPVEGEAKKNVPQLVLKGEEDPYAPAAPAGEEGAVAEVSGEGGNKYRTAYYSFEDDFTSNLQNSVGLIQVSLAASTHYDGRVLMWLKKHELAIRSQVLVELANTPEEEILTPEGKQNLQKRLAAAINKVLTEREGFGGVNAVYFRSVLVQ